MGMDEFPSRAAAKLEMLSEDSTEFVHRKLIRYESEPGSTTEAYIVRPVDCPRGRPGVVVFHSTVPYSILQPAGLRGASEKAFGSYLAKQGYVTICPRNYLWKTNVEQDISRGVSRHRARHQRALGMAKMLHDGQTALDVLANLPEVNRERLGAVGHSLGAKQVLYLAAFDTRIKCAVASEGGVGKYMSNWHADWYLGKHFVFNQSALDHHQLLATVAPRPLLLIGGNADDGVPSETYVQAARQVYNLFESGDRLKFANHGQGHKVPPAALDWIRHWFEKWLPIYKEFDQTHNCMVNCI